MKDTSKNISAVRSNQYHLLSHVGVTVYYETIPYLRGSHTYAGTRNAVLLFFGFRGECFVFLQGVEAGEGFIVRDKNGMSP